MPAPRILRAPRRTLRRLVRRHRRPLAALTAGIGVLLALTTLHGGSSAATATAVVGDVRTVASDEVIVPVLLSSAAVAAVLAEGDIVDIVGFTGDGTQTATVIAPRVRIVGLPASGDSFTASSTAVILVAAPPSQALALSAASADGGVGVLIHGS